MMATSSSTSAKQVQSVSVVVSQILEPTESMEVFTMLGLVTRKISTALVLVAANARHAGCIDNEPKCLATCLSDARKCSFTTKRIVASGNAIRHFGLEFTMDDGSIYTMEKFPWGTHFYEGASSRKLKHHTTVWSIPMNEKTIHSDKKSVTLFDLQQIHKEQEKIPYSLLRNNCKRLAWSVLKQLFRSDILVQLEREPVEENKVDETPARRVTFRYSEFRDFCQLKDMKPLLPGGHFEEVEQ